MTAGASTGWNGTAGDGPEWSGIAGAGTVPDGRQARTFSSPERGGPAAGRGDGGHRDIWTWTWPRFSEISSIIDYFCVTFNWCRKIKISDKGALNNVGLYGNI